MYEQFAFLVTPHAGFIALVLIGVFAGWLAGMVAGTRHWIVTNILIGIAGSWLGSHLADILGMVAPGSLGHFVAALVGALLIITVWQRLHPEQDRRRSRSSRRAAPHIGRRSPRDALR
jgi:uncharacterized membrane protein YeaQ/YmgE (transglycosylase-associated protein family)